MKSKQLIAAITAAVCILGSNSILSVPQENSCVLTAEAVAMASLPEGRIYEEGIFDGFQYARIDDFVLLVRCLKGKETETIEIPSEINGAPVQEIYLNSFYAFSNLKRVVIPETVTTIGESAFAGCTSLTDVVLPSSVTNFDKNAFQGTPFLENCFGDSDFAVVNGVLIAARNCSGEVHIPDTVTRIGNYVFDNNKQITAVYMTESVTEIGECAFNYCKNLKDIQIPATVTRIGRRAFYETPWEKEQYDEKGLFIINNIFYAVKPKEECPQFTIPEGVVTIGDSPFENAYKGHFQEIILPSTLRTIENNAFFLCNDLQRIVIPEGVTSIGTDAFYGCRSLQSISISSTVTECEGIMRECKQLESITVAENNPVYCSVDGIMFNRDKTELCQYPAAKPDTFYQVPDGVRTIGYGAFSFAANLETIQLPDTLESIWLGAFENCTKLKVLQFPNSLKYIAQSAFTMCVSLESITLPKNVVQLGALSFGGCKALQNVTILNPKCSFSSLFKPFLSAGDNITIHGYADSTAQAYALQCDIPFDVLKPAVLMGDVTNDNEVNIADVIILLRYINEDGELDMTLCNLEAADCDEDGVISTTDTDWMLKKIAKLN